MIRHLAMLGTAGACAFPTLASAADVPAGNATKATMTVSNEFTSGTFEASGDADWYRVALKKGQDLALSCMQSAYIDCDLRDDKGKAVATAMGGQYIDSSVEYWVPKNSTDFVEAKHKPNGYDAPPLLYDVRLAPDCRADKTTTCAPKPNRSWQPAPSSTGPR